MSRASTNRFLHLLRLSIEHLSVDSSCRISSSPNSTALTQLFRVRSNDEVLNVYFEPLVRHYLHRDSTPTVESFSRALTGENPHLSGISEDPSLEGRIIPLGEWVERLVSTTYHWLIDEALYNVASTYNSRYDTELSHWVRSLQDYNQRRLLPQEELEQPPSSHGPKERKVHEDGSRDRMVTSLLATPLGPLVEKLLFYEAYEYIVLNTEVLVAALPEMKVMSETYLCYDDLACEIGYPFCEKLYPGDDAENGGLWEDHFEEWLRRRLETQYGERGITKTDIENYLAQPENLRDMTAMAHQIRSGHLGDSKMEVDSSGTAGRSGKRVREGEMRRSSTTTSPLRKRERGTGVVQG